MKVRLPFCLGLALLAATLTCPALAEQSSARVALVIGNASYPGAGTPPANTVEDARTLAEELGRSGFDVELEEDVGKVEMERAIDAFMGRIRSGTAALFYFGGYGIQVARQSYLIPVNAQIWAQPHVRRDGIGLDAVLAEMDRRGAKAKIVIVDAARRNPFERRFRKAPAGLAAVSAPAGTLVMYAAAPGKVIRDGTGANSLFMGELIKELRVPNRTVGAIFSRTRIGVSRASNYEQVPWVASSLGEELYWGERPVATGQAPSPAPTTPGPATAGAPTSTPGEVVGQGFKPGEIFRDCPDCPELVVVPAGSFDMGSSRQYESPVHPVIIAKPFAIGRHEVTFDEWDKCADEGGCKHRPDDRQWGRGDRPVINVNWLDAKAFTVWLSRKTGQTYRLPSEAEWEYATRGGTETPYWWGRSVGSRHANCVQCNTGGPRRTSEVGSYEPNAFGLYDTAGNAAEWVEDCWNADYRGAPRNGSARETGQCRLRVLRGGAFDSSSRYLRSASRFRYDMDVRYVANGFRVLRELP